MKIDVKKVKIIVTVPVENSEEVRNAICDEGAGIIGNYTYCTISTKCIGTFKPSDNANPYIGENNKLEFVEEEKLEFVDMNYGPFIDLELNHEIISKRGHSILKIFMIRS